ncbi:MAG: hypothetical protein HKN33_10430 [Pyrinomonadaceae bacterium]|nr:hypothetical protein [Pyrinomonadaceae bacterium]
MRKHLTLILTLSTLILVFYFVPKADGQGKSIDHKLKKIPVFDISAEAGDPCDASVPIGFGETINGSLTAADCQLKDNSYADFYTFEGVAGRQVTIDFSSAEFDTYLALTTISGSFTWEDDDGGPGTNSRIIANLPETGTYVIAANSLLPNTFGNYSVTLNDTTPCSFTLDPISQTVPSTGGSFSFQVTANDQDCEWTATSFVPWTTTSSTGTGNGTVDYMVDPSDESNDRFGNIRVNNTVFSIRQEAIICTLSFNPPSASFPAEGGIGSFNVTTQPTCSWSATGGVGTSSSSSGTGNGTVDYSVSNNSGDARSIAVFVTVQTNTTNFPITQAGLNCSYSTSDSEIYVGPFETTGVLRVITQPGCNWNAVSNSGFIPIGVTSGNGSGDIPYTVETNPNSTERSGAIQISQVPSVWVTQGGTSFRIPFDFDGDSRTDISIFRPAPAEWWYLRSSDGGNGAFQFGSTNNRLTPADFTGDGKTDVAFWRENTGEWFVLRSEDSSFYSFPFGTTGDIPAPGDYDGDGKADPAVFRPSTADWFISRSSDGGVDILTFGTSGDLPVIADYDRDGKSDIAVFRESLGEWWIIKSQSQSVYAVQFGAPGDIPAPQDFSGDDADDVAFFRPTTGEWFVLRSENQSFFSFPFGQDGDIPVAGDYDRDGIADAAVFRPSENTWYLSRSNDGFQAVTFGIAGDIPVPSGFVR